MTGAGSGPTWRGAYFDGQVARRHDVLVGSHSWGIALSFEDGTQRRWLHSEITLAADTGADDQVRLERHAGGAVEVLVVTDPAFRQSLESAVPSRERDKLAARGRWRSGGRVWMLVGVALAVGSAAYLWGLPWMAAGVAARIPVQWEEQLGAGLVEQIAPPDRVCVGEERMLVLEGIVQRLVASSPESGYEFRLTVVDDSLVNAVAAPGGYIVIFHGLLARAESAEEVAGVLAHEIQHVVRRHGTTAVLKQVPLQLAATLVTGDDAIAGGLIGTAVTLGALRYQRGAETEADREGFRMLQASRISPDGMIRFFDELAGSGADAPALLQYLSTHPRSEARVEVLRGLAVESPYEAEPLLDEATWSRVRAPCDAR